MNTPATEAAPRVPTQYPDLPLTERATVTPLLAARIKQYGLILPKFRPVYDRLLVYPLESKDQSETFAGTSIIKPRVTQENLGASRGVLVKAGPAALDVLWAHGFELGHIVLTARFSPWERKYDGGGTIHRVLVLRVSDLVGSEDLEDDVLDGHVDFEKDDDGHLRIKDRSRIEPPGTDDGM